MKIVEIICKNINKFMSIIVLAVAGVALFLPKSLSWISTSWVNYLLMLVMFGMGLTLKLSDLAIVFKKPKAVLIGCIAQFTIMPLLAFLLGKGFGLESALLAGVILVGTCPGGTSSNVMTYLSGGDIALSVGMTSINTLIAPFLTPLITYLFLQTTVTVDMLAMFTSIINVVILPIALGFVVNKLFASFTQKLKKVFPTISIIAICMIVASVVSANSQQILSTGLIVFIVVILHNSLGYLSGLLIAKAFRLSPDKQKALSIEIGMQNSGLATSLAKTAFPDLAMATVPGAIFSVWHNISGAIIASIYSKFLKNDK